jgi:hypothetical protein
MGWQFFGAFTRLIVQSVFAPKNAFCSDIGHIFWGQDKLEEC